MRIVTLDLTNDRDFCSCVSDISDELNLVPSDVIRLSIFKLFTDIYPEYYPDFRGVINDLYCR